VIHRLRLLGARPTNVIKRLEQEKDPSIRRALLLILGEYSDKDLPVSERERLLPLLLDFYRDSDPGLHAAAAWLLQQWGRDKELQGIQNEWANDNDRREKTVDSIRQDLARNRGTAKPRWLVNSQGQTFVVFPGPVEFQMGSPPTEEDRGPEEVRHSERIGHTFALATTHVTRQQFKRFRPEVAETREFAPDKRCPIFGATWYEAAEYCNWLSKQEGLQENEWCYEANKDGKHAEGMSPAVDYLNRTGYRLPTEAEWEYACRAGSVTSRYYGESKDLLGKYAWFDANAENHVWPVASLKPNDSGLFDMHGQLWVWCQDRYINSKAKGPQDERRVVRGGSWGEPAGVVRCANRSGALPNNRLLIVGFRVARTFR
jgi:formylglycine-generating enzyme required for sulfatase activity